MLCLWRFWPQRPALARGCCWRPRKDWMQQSRRLRHRRRRPWRFFRCCGTFVCCLRVIMLCRWLRRCFDARAMCVAVASNVPLVPLCSIQPHRTGLELSVQYSRLDKWYISKRTTRQSFNFYDEQHSHQLRAPAPAQHPCSRLESPHSASASIHSCCICHSSFLSRLHLLHHLSTKRCHYRVMTIYMSSLYMYHYRYHTRTMTLCLAYTFG
jgi:hypothetical protein